MDLFDQKELDEIELLFISLQNDPFITSNNMKVSINETLDKEIYISSKDHNLRFGVYFEKGTEGFFKKPWYLVHMDFWNNPKIKSPHGFIIGDDNEYTKFKKFPIIRRQITQFIKTALKTDNGDLLYEASGFKHWS